MSRKSTGQKHILLADDDDDDRLLFLDVLKEIPLSSTELTIAKNGEHLMNLLHEQTSLPDLLFLDLNMPLKNGFECLLEIKSNSRLRNLPVIIFSTSSQPSAIHQVYEDGARFYIRKPNDFTNLKKVIELVLSMNIEADGLQPPLENFVLKP